MKQRNNLEFVTFKAARYNAQLVLSPWHIANTQQCDSTLFYRVAALDNSETQTVPRWA